MLCRHAECRILIVIMVSVVMLSVIMLSVIKLSVVILRVAYYCTSFLPEKKSDLSLRPHFNRALTAVKSFIVQALPGTNATNFFVRDLQIFLIS